MNNTPSYPEASGPGWHRPAGVTSRRPLPLTVWLCSDTTGTNTRKGNDGENQRAKHSAVSARHRQMVGCELARHLIGACTREGDLVADAYTTSEATLLVAAQLGRRAVACVSHLPLAQHIGNRLRRALPEDKLAGLAMRPCRPDQMHRGMADHAGKVALVVAAPPPYEIGGPATDTEGNGCPVCRADRGCSPSSGSGRAAQTALSVRPHTQPVPVRPRRRSRPGRGLRLDQRREARACQAGGRAGGRPAR
jgi:hypothetical protein